MAEEEVTEAQEVATATWMRAYSEASFISLLFARFLVLGSDGTWCFIVLEEQLVASHP